MKKGMFSMMNYYLPLKGIASMHCSATVSYTHLDVYKRQVLSFAFYIPVVLLADVIPMIGMLMIPKTCAYVWTVLIAVSYTHLPETRMKGFSLDQYVSCLQLSQIL